ncbi:histidine kinase [Aliarcobacter trophiarum LMG 25534]|uniref:Histidine kinase n=1 Tax=Aliarcobacter trophiarum LMG 25534 TaxID=1032241 RepID=A0AAD0QKP0_9BACT|nr:PAS sensor-containing signal transduction protein [Aliarcobacter trophiarum LMG 25534]RXJ91455.1 histidine kinase [Aliarcobacter trophiarum LMG 25534]
MREQHLFYRCLVLFFITSLLAIIGLNSFKTNSLKNLEESKKNEILSSYDSYFNDLKKRADFIYFNEFVQSNKIISILQNNSQNSLKERLYLEFEPQFSFYKHIELYDISFYTKDAIYILNFKDEQIEDKFADEIVLKTKSTKKDSSDIKMEDDKLYIIFSKAIIDEKLELLGFVNFEFDFEKFLESINGDLNKKSILLLDNNKIDKNFIEVLVLTDKKTIYLNKNSFEDSVKVIELENYYLFLTIFSIVILAVLSFLIYLIRILKYKNREIEHKYSELFSQLDEYVLKLDTDLDGKITFVTKYFCEVSGYSKSDILGKNVNILRHPDISINFYRKFWKDLKKLKIWNGELKNKDKFGNTYWIRTSLFPIYNSDKTICGYSSIRTDITAIKQLEKANRILKEDLSNKLNELRVQDKTVLNSTKIALMSKILDSFSHQWKTPIAKISFELQKLDNIKDIYELKEIKNSVESELLELSNLLNDTKSLFSNKFGKKANISKIVKELVLKLNSEEVVVLDDLKEDIEVNILNSELKSIVSNIVYSILDLSKLYSIERVKIIISIEYDTNEDFVLKIEDNIKDIRKENFLKEILKFEDDKYFDTKLHLAKLLIEKNQAIFWSKVLEEKTSYYIKFKKSNNEDDF